MAITLGLGGLGFMVVTASTTTATDVGIVMAIATVIATYKCYSVVGFTTLVYWHLWHYELK